MNRIRHLTDAQLRERWRHRLDLARDDFHEIAEGQKRFEQFSEMVRSNSRLQEIGAPFLDWIYRSHAHASVVAVRRHGDGLGNDRSLDTLLEEIAARPYAINRAAYMAQWGADTPGYPQMARLAFEGFPIVPGPSGADSDHIDPAAVEEDIRALDRASRRIIDWANANVTHSTDRPVPSVTYADLRQAIADQQKIFGRYYALLTQSAIAEFTPVDQFDAMECFTFPWLAPEKQDEQ